MHLKEVNHLPDYVDTYPDDEMFLRASKMKLYSQSDAGYLNEEKSTSRASTHAHISEHPYFCLQRGGTNYSTNN